MVATLTRMGGDGFEHDFECDMGATPSVSLTGLDEFSVISLKRVRTNYAAVLVL